MRRQREFYKVLLRSTKYHGEEDTLYVMARNLREAEKRAIKAAKRNGTFSNRQAIYAKEATFVGYIF